MLRFRCTGVVFIVFSIHCGTHATATNFEYRLVRHCCDVAVFFKDSKAREKRRISLPSMTAKEVWTPEELTAKYSADAITKDPMLWGVPGYLTKDEIDVFVQFKAEVEKRDEAFKSTIYCFGEEEGEVWAYCRWLRARKYVLADVLTMIEEATETRKEARAMDFYPNPVDALGVEASLFFAQYPQVYTGFAKNGAPIFISKPGILNVDGMECITTLDGIIKFHWYVMMHDFAQRLRKQKAKDPNFKK